jgi:hypothetical protein
MEFAVIGRSRNYVITKRLTDEIALNIGPDAQLVGIEALDAKETLGKGEPPQLVVDNLKIRAA